MIGRGNGKKNLELLKISSINTYIKVLTNFSEIHSFALKHNNDDEL